MEKEIRSPVLSSIIVILVWGGLWGIFEATVGYFLHLLPISIGWLIWYPVACFFMLNVYRKTRRAEAVLLVGLLAASVKLFNLFLPGGIDRVLNPAISIVFEALALAAVIVVVKHFCAERQSSVAIKALTVLCMNTGWRILYVLYLLFLVPDWMREISVISNAEAFATFFLGYNLLTSLVLFVGYIAKAWILKPITAIENKWSVSISAFPKSTAAVTKITGTVCLLGGSVALGLLL